MIGAIAGDVIGSVYEHRKPRSPDYPLIAPLCRFTDDTVLTVATAHAILTGSFPLTKNVQQQVGEADPQGIDDMMRRVRLIPSHTQPLFAPRVTIHTRDGIAHTLEATGREFIMSFDQLAKRLSPIGAVVPVGEQQYAELVAECRQMDHARDVSRLIALTCPPQPDRP